VSDQETLAIDAEAIVLRMWDQRMRAAIRPLLTKKVIEEHRRDSRVVKTSNTPLEREMTAALRRSQTLPGGVK
jgi:hypothetical protein